MSKQTFNVFEVEAIANFMAGFAADVYRAGGRRLTPCEVESAVTTFLICKECKMDMMGKYLGDKDE